MPDLDIAAIPVEQIPRLLVALSARLLAESVAPAPTTHSGKFNEV
jgi:hypothetical protein